MTTKEIQDLKPGNVLIDITGYGEEHLVIRFGGAGTRLVDTDQSHSWVSSETLKSDFVLKRNKDGTPFVYVDKMGNPAWTTKAKTFKDDVEGVVHTHTNGYINQTFEFNEGDIYVFSPNGFMAWKCRFPVGQEHADLAVAILDHAKAFVEAGKAKI